MHSEVNELNFLRISLFFKFSRFRHSRPRFPCFSCPNSQVLWCFRTFLTYFRTFHRFIRTFSKFFQIGWDFKENIGFSSVTFEDFLQFLRSVFLIDKSSKSTNGPFQKNFGSLLSVFRMIKASLTFLDFFSGSFEILKIFQESFEIFGLKRKFLDCLEQFSDLFILFSGYFRPLFEPFEF